MSVEEARSLLIQKEIEDQELRDKLAHAQKQFELAISEVTETERARQEIRKEIESARTQLAREEQIAAQHERAGEIDADVLTLTAKFTEIASDKPWFTGTGNDDAVLSHQWQGMMFGAVAERWILGDGVGLGKTRTAVGWLDLVKAKRVVIVCEANICAQFAGEVMELAPHRKLYNISKKSPAIRHQMLDEILSEDAAVVVANFEIWRRDKDTLAKLIMWHADTVIVDEAHNLKSTSTANFGNVKMLISMDNVCPKCGGDIKGLWDKHAMKPCLSCGWKVGDPTPIRTENKLDALLQTRSVKNICLTTGTPILNSPLDLFALLHLCNPIMFNTLNRFKKMYLTSNYHAGKWEFSRGALDDMKPLIEGMFLARTAEDAGVVLPEQTHEAVAVVLDKNEYPRQWKAIRQISDAAQLILESGEAMTIMHLISLITRKRQANVWPGGIVIKDNFGEVIFDAGSEITESVKMDAIMERVKEHHALGHRQIVFSQFKTALTEFEKRLKAEGIRAVRFDGDTPPKLRTEIKADFAKEIDNPRWDVVCMNYRTGGTGINLVGATVTHIMDSEWNPGKRDQAYGRTSRIGQLKKTKVLVYSIPGTIDTWMSNTMKRKQDMIEGFNDKIVGSPTLAMDLLEAIKNGDVL